MVDLSAGQFAALHRLSSSERWMIIRDQIEANAEAGRKSIWAKFKKFALICTQRGWQAIPADRDQIYAFVLFLRVERCVSVWSMPAYLLAISTVHRWAGILNFTAHDDITERLRLAWHHRIANNDSRDTIKAFLASNIFVLIMHGLQATAPSTVRMFLSVVLNTVFFSQADLGHQIFSEDLWFEDHLLVFRERRLKGKAVHELTWRLRSYNTRGVPALRDPGGAFSQLTSANLAAPWLYGT